MVKRAIALEEDGVLADAYRTYGEIMHGQGNFAAAEEFMMNSVAILEQHEEPDQYLLGYGWRALAKLYSAQNMVVKARQAKATAIEYFDSINLQYEADRTASVEIG